MLAADRAEMAAETAEAAEASDSSHSATRMPSLGARMSSLRRDSRKSGAAADADATRVPYYSSEAAESSLDTACNRLSAAARIDDTASEASASGRGVAGKSPVSWHIPFSRGRSLRGASRPSRRPRQLIVSRDEGEIGSCDHFLLYLTSLTWTSGAASSALAAEVNDAT